MVMIVILMTNNNYKYVQYLLDYLIKFGHHSVHVPKFGQTWKLLVGYVICGFIYIM